MSRGLGRYVWLLVVAAGLAGLGAGLAVHAWLNAEPAAEPSGPAPAATADDVIGEPRPPFTLADPDGGERAIAEFDGRVVLLNFWASWCGPCREEVPALVAAQEALGDQGLQVVGLALDDAEPVRDFAAEYGINYPLMIGGRDAFAVTADYGNGQGVLPYTVVIDREGIIREAHMGALTRREIEALVKPFL